MEDYKLKTTIKVDDQEQDFQSNVNEVATSSSNNANVIKKDNNNNNGDELKEGEIREDGDKAPVNKKAEIEAPKKITVCPYCGAEFSDPRAFGGHVRVHPQHKDKTTRKRPGPNRSRYPNVNPKLVEGKVKRVAVKSRHQSSKAENEGYKFKYDQLFVGSGSGSGSGLDLCSILAAEGLGWKAKGRRNGRAEVIKVSSSEDHNEGCSNNDEDGEPRRASVDIDLNRRVRDFDLNEMPKAEEDE